MLKVKTYCLPAMKQEELLKLHQAIVGAAVKIPELNVKSENDMCNLFVPDLMTYGLGTEIIIEISGVNLDENTRNNVSCAVGMVVKKLFPKPISTATSSNMAGTQDTGHLRRKKSLKLSKCLMTAVSSLRSLRTLKLPIFPGRA